MSMKFQELEQFLAVYEERNVTIAAQKLGLTQQSLSKTIARLESRYKVQLFTRKPAFAPTLAAHYLADSSQKMLRLKKEVDAELTDLSYMQKGTLKFGMSAYLACEMMPWLLNRYRPQHEGVTLRIVSGHSDVTEAKVISGELDFHVGSAEEQKKDLHQVPLFNVSPGLAVREDFLQRYLPETAQKIDALVQEGAFLREFIKVPLLLPQRGWGVRDALDRFFRAYKLTPTVILEGAQQIIASAVRNGTGAGIVYTSTSIPAEQDGHRICRFKLRDVDYKINFYLSYRKDHYVKSYEKDFFDLIFEYVTRFSDNDKKTEGEDA